MTTKLSTTERMRREAHRFVTRHLSDADVEWLADEIKRVAPLVAESPNTAAAAYRAWLVVEYATLIADRFKTTAEEQVS